MAKEKKDKKDSSDYNSIDDVFADINREYGDGTLTIVDSNAVVACKSISTGIANLDKALGIGGIPRGRIVEIFGPESSGKTTVALECIAQCQQLGEFAAFIDAEHALDIQWARSLGVDIKRLAITQPDSGEQGLQICEKLLRSHRFGIIVIDSVAALVPQAEIDGEMGDSHMGLQARMLSQGMRKLCAEVTKSNTCLLFINQLREKIGIMFGNPETTPGGRALKFYSSVRLDIRRIGPVKVGETVVGNNVRVKVIKNKVAPPFQEAEFKIYFGRPEYPVYGPDICGSWLEVGVSVGVLGQKGSWYSYGDVRIGNGLKDASSNLRNNKELFDKIRADVQAKIKLTPTMKAAETETGVAELAAVSDGPIDLDDVEGIE